MGIKDLEEESKEGMGDCIRDREGSDTGRSRRLIKYEIKDIVEERLHGGVTQQGFGCGGY